MVEYLIRRKVITKFAPQKSYGYLEAMEDKTVLNFKVAGILMKTLNTKFVSSS